MVDVQSRVGDLLDLEGCAGGVAIALRQEGELWDINQFLPTVPTLIIHHLILMYGGFQGGPQLGPQDAERRQSLGQL